MRLVAHLGVLDERELIGRALDHLRAIGVDQIIVCDMGSTDGTLDILWHRRAPDLTLVNLSKDASWEVWHQAALEAIGRADADWALFLDADEFWLPRSGSLKSCESLSGSDVLKVNRYNVVVGSTGVLLPDQLSPQSYDHVLLYCKKTPPYWKMREDDPSALWIRAVPAPKVMARTELIGEIIMGTHAITPADDTPVRQVIAEDLVIGHVPFSTLSRFERRVRNVEDFFSHSEDYFKGKNGWHWRHWREVGKQGRIAEEFRSQLVDEALLAQLRCDGVVRTAAELLNSGCRGQDEVNSV